MATYSIKAIKYCEQTVPGPQMYFMSRWDQWLDVDFFFFVLRRDDGKVVLIDTGVRDVDEMQPLVLAGVGAKGHAAVGLYPLLADVGFFDPALLDTYTRLGSPFGDHPDMRKIPGIDFSSGSLGHGLSVGVGMALAARVTGRAYRVYVLLGDGELDEGQVWEAAMSASHFDLGNLIAIVDRNRVSVDGETAEVMGLEPLREKWEAFGWQVWELDGHDLEALLDCLTELSQTRSDRPTVIIAHTVAGKGVSFMEDKFEWHLGYLAPADEDQALAELEEDR